MSEIKTNITTENCVISDDVIATIACSAALEVPGVSSMATRPVNVKRFVQSDGNKSVKVTRFNDDVALDLYVNLLASARIPDVSLEIQKNVKSEVQSMIGKPFPRLTFM